MWKRVCLPCILALFALSTFAACGGDDDEGTKQCNETCQGDEECVDGYSCVYARVNNTTANTVCMPDPCKTCGSGCTFSQTSAKECKFVACK